MNRKWIGFTALVGLLAISLCAFGITGGVKTVTAAGTAEALSTSKILFHDLFIVASNANTGYIYVGGSNVDKTTKNGFELAAGKIYVIADGMLNEVYIDSTVNGEGVSYTYQLVANYD